MPKTKPQQEKKLAGAGAAIEVEPGAEKRLANILKKALNTPTTRKAKPERRAKPK